LIAFGAALGAGVVMPSPPTYTIPLISLFGSLSNQYIPLFAMTSGPVRIELQLVSDLLKCLNSHTALSTTATDSYIDNVEFCAQFIELSDSAIDTIMQSLHKDNHYNSLQHNTETT
jgi:hypothetical protein